jgi:hypothetical protein
LGYLFTQELDIDARSLEEFFYIHELAFDERRQQMLGPDVFMLHQMRGGTELEFVIMVIAVSCVKLLSAHNSTQHTSRKHKV